MVATDWPDDLARAIRALVAYAPDGTQLVVVADGPSEAQAAALGRLEATEPGAPGVTTEVTWTAGRLGWAAALNAGIRRAAAPVVVLLDTCVETGRRPRVGPRGGARATRRSRWPDRSASSRRTCGASSRRPPRRSDVDAIGGYALAFRRSDYVARGPLDEHFAFYRNLDLWWSLVLRDQAEDDPEGAPPRRAVQITSVPVTRHEHRGWASLPEDERDRRSKKNFYRVLKRFATRRDLLVDGGR